MIILLLFLFPAFSSAFFPGLNKTLTDELDEKLLSQVGLDKEVLDALKLLSDPVKMINNGDLGQVSEQCAHDVQTYTTEASTILSPAFWSKKMLDASGKLISPGVLQGSILDSPGNMNSCLEVDSGTFLGEYCLLSIKLKENPTTRTARMSVDLNTILSNYAPKFNRFQRKIRIGHCLPNSCSRDEVQTLYQSSLDTLNISEVTDLSITCKDVNFKYDFTAGDIVASTVIAILGTLVIVGTLIDIAVYHYGDEFYNERFLAMFQGFSAHNVLKKIFRVTPNNDGLACINGIRFWSMVWVIVGHTYLRFYLEGVPFENNHTDSLEITKSKGLRLIFNASPSVDSFFLIGGLLLGYLTIKEVEKQKGGSVKFWIMYYVHRYIRITGALAGVVMFSATLMKFIPTKLEYQIKYEQGLCQEKWWRNVLYINNINNPEDCLGQTWYTAVEMQMFLITPFIFLITYKRPLIGNIVTLLLILGSLGWRLSILLDHYGELGFDEFAIIYTKPYTRFATYGTGLITGNILYHLREKQLDRKYNIIMICGWLISLGSMAAIIFGYDLFDQEMSKFAYVLYQTMFRCVWGLCLAFIIFACAKGYGGPIGSFLSWNAWAPLAKLTYSSYLIHFIVINSTIDNFTYRVSVSQPLVIFFSISNVIISMGASIIPVLLFEAPTMHLEKIIFGYFGLSKFPKSIKYKKE